MRHYSPAVIAAQGSGELVPAWLVELDLGFSILHIWTAPGQLTWHGRTFGFPVAAGAAAADAPPVVMSVSNIEESAEGRASGLNYTISGIPLSSVAGQAMAVHAA